MSLVNYRPTNAALNAASLLTVLGKNPQLRNQLVAGIQGLTTQVGKLMGSSSMVQQPNLPYRITGSKKTKSSKGRQARNRSRRSRNPSSGPGRTLNEYEPNVRITALLGVGTAGVTGISSNTYFMGYKDTTFTSDMVTMSTQYFNFAANYQFQRINRINVEWKPYTPYTTAGIITMCVNEDPTYVATPSSIQQVIQKRVAADSDVKECCRIVWTPSDEQQREVKENADASAATGASLRNFAPCAVWVRAETNLTAGPATVGFVQFTWDITFSALK